MSIALSFVSKRKKQFDTKSIHAQNRDVPRNFLSPIDKPKANPAKAFPLSRCNVYGCGAAHLPCSGLVFKNNKEHLPNYAADHFPAVNRILTSFHFPLCEIRNANEIQFLTSFHMSGFPFAYLATFEEKTKQTLSKDLCKIFLQANKLATWSTSGQDQIIYDNLQSFRNVSSKVTNFNLAIEKVNLDCEANFFVTPRNDQTTTFNKQHKSVNDFSSFFSAHSASKIEKSTGK